MHSSPSLLLDFILIFTASLLPLPALPFIILAYFNHGYIAALIVIPACLSSCFVQYFFASTFVSLLPRRLRDSSYLTRASLFLSSLNLFTFTALRLAGLIPSKLINICAGLVRYSPQHFLLSTAFSIIVYQPVYVVASGLASGFSSFLFLQGSPQIVSDLSFWFSFVGFVCLLSSLLFSLAKLTFLKCPACPRP
jgi:uncharacterized membrane protein YdjX (TVP38/TMEM64 family)